MSRSTQFFKRSQPHTTMSRPGAIGGRLRGIGGRFLGKAKAGMRGMHRRGHGISKTELRGFRKVVSLLRRVGMVPKGTRKAPVRRS